MLFGAFDAEASKFAHLFDKAIFTPSHASFVFALATVHVPGHGLGAFSVGLRTFFWVKNALAAPPEPTHTPRSTTCSLTRGRLALEVLSWFRSVFPICSEPFEDLFWNALTNKVWVKSESRLALNAALGLACAPADSLGPKHAIVRAASLFAFAFLRLKGRLHHGTVLLVSSICAGK